MIQLGVNSVLFQRFDFATACRCIAEIGYDGIEISAIKGMCEHLDLDSWHDQAKDLRTIAEDAGLKFLSMEEAALDEERLLEAFDAAAEIGIPVVNIGPGGRSDIPADLDQSIEVIGRMADEAHKRGVSLCAKAHVGAAIFNTPTTLQAMKAIKSPGFGVDMDPSHIFRAGEDPSRALGEVISRVRHIHIRDCRGKGPSPGFARDQACGRGDINLPAYCRAMVDGKYDGPVCLEVIGAGELELTQVVTIAAESYGYLNACLKALGAR